jgi:hypothetical protein
MKRCSGRLRKSSDVEGEPLKGRLILKKLRYR